MKKSQTEVYVPAEIGSVAPPQRFPNSGQLERLFWNRVMTPMIVNRFAPVIRLLLVAALLVANFGYAAADQPRVQFCWAMGTHDHTIYFAEIENREDRQASFDTLLEISGIDHHAVKCTISDPATHLSARARLMKDWRESEFEIVNTTFLSDLDY